MCERIDEGPNGRPVPYAVLVGPPALEIVDAVPVMTRHQLLGPVAYPVVRASAGRLIATVAVPVVQCIGDLCSRRSWWCGGPREVSTHLFVRAVGDPAPRKRARVGGGEKGGTADGYGLQCTHEKGQPHKRHLVVVADQVLARRRHRSGPPDRRGLWGRGAEHEAVFRSVFRSVTRWRNHVGPRGRRHRGRGCEGQKHDCMAVLSPAGASLIRWHGYVNPWERAPRNPVPRRGIKWCQTRFSSPNDDYPTHQ